MRKICLFILLCCAWSVSLEAQVKMKVRADGIPFIYNEDPVQRERRTATDLRPLPAKQTSLMPMIERHAAAHGLDARLVQAVIQVESGYNPQALSAKGAMGLMQLMPATAKELRVRNAYDPDDNIRGGTLYLRRLLDRFGSLEKALAGYNAGPTAVLRYGGVPPYRETQGFVRRVLRIFQGDGVRAPMMRSGTSAQPEPNRPPVYIRRDSNNRILITTEPTDGR